MKNEFTLTKKKQLTKTVWAFYFSAERLPSWDAGQYMEWVLPHEKPDKRGTRRFFTICASPTEKELMFATKIIDKPSSFKVTLRDLNVGDPITARDVDGDFVLPKDPQEKLVFIAGGIGITPFRSMVKYLLDTGENRDIVLLYANKDSSDVAFSELFKEAEKIGLKTVFYFTNETGMYSTFPCHSRAESLYSTPPARLWRDIGNLYNNSGSPISNSIRAEDDSVTSAKCIKDKNIENIVLGFITPEEIQARVSDWQGRTFYVSGPEPMVEAFEKLLNKMGIKGKNIKTDFFPGYSEAYQEEK